MYFDDIGDTLIFILIVAVIGGFVVEVVSFTTTVTDTTYSETYPIYKATLPFGVISLSGELNGGFAFFAGSIHGEISSEEMYYIKYFDDDELKSLSLEAQKTPLVIDNEFYVEEVWEKRTYNKFFLWEAVIFDRVDGYKIHIPRLPEVSDEMTEDWIR